MTRKMQIGLVGVLFGSVSLIYTIYALLGPGVPLDQIIVGMIFAIGLFIVGLGLAISAVATKNGKKIHWTIITAFGINTVPLIIYLYLLFELILVTTGAGAFWLILVVILGISYLVLRVVEGTTGMRLH